MAKHDEKVKEILKVYIEIDIDKLESYLVKEAYGLNISYVHLCTLVFKYAQKCDEQIKANYEKKKHMFKIYNTVSTKKILNILDVYKKIGVNIFINEERVKEKLTNYMNLIDYRTEEVKEILEAYKEFEDREIIAFDLKAYSYGNYKPKYELEFIEILNCDTELSSYICFRNLKYTRSIFERNLELFNKRFINSHDYSSRLRVLFEGYVDYFNLEKEEEKVVAFCEIKEKREQANELIRDVLHSDYSIDDYCHLHLDIDSADIKRNIKILCGENKLLLENIFSVLESRKTVLAKKAALDILSVMYGKIAEDSKLDLIDYFTRTKLSLEDFERVLKENRCNPGFELNSFLKASAKKISQKSFEYRINKEKELNTGAKVKLGYEIPEELKIRIFDFMEGSIPIFTTTYSVLMEKILKGEEIEDFVTNKKISYDISKLKKFNL